jgi:hypothetical protein
MVGGKQQTDVWHADDWKISNVDSKVVDLFIEDMESEFGKETPLSKSRGKVYDYLGMILDFNVKGELAANMIPYVKMVLDSIPRDMIGRAATPAVSYLYQVNEVIRFFWMRKQLMHFTHMLCSYLCLSQA